MATRLEVYEKSKERVKNMRFGDPITNICAGEKNPHRHSFFVQYIRDSQLVRCTDKKGSFWKTGMNVIHPGHLPYDECEKLFKPVWESEYAN